MPALYHTHRPQLFATILGQEFIVQTLKNEIKQDKLAHAYLFSGPRGVGKTTTARILAKAVNCEQRQAGEFEPCNTCTSCTAITAGNAIDVIEIDAASHTGVDNVRENIIDNAQFKPTRSRFKVFIIDEVHMLSTSAFNALLKTLEEPPAHIIFILATTELHKLPETIVSRCQRFTFLRAKNESLSTHLLSLAKSENREVDAEVIERIVQKSDGGVRDAISLFEQIIRSTEGPITASTINFLLPTVSGENVKQFCDSLLSRSREALIILQTTREIGQNALEFTDMVLRYLRDLLVADNAVDKKALVVLLDKLLVRRNQINQSPLPFLPLEMLVLDTNSESFSVAKKEIKIEAPIEQVKKDIPKDIPTVPVPPKPLLEVTPPAPAPAPAPDQTQTLSPGENLDRKAVEKAWQKIIKILEEDSPSLVFILKMATLADIQGSTLTLKVQYKFHLDNLLKVEARHKLETLLGQELQTKVEIIGVLSEPTPEADRSELQNLAVAFGGEVL